MQLNNTEKMAFEFDSKIRDFFGNRVDNFCVSNVIDDINHQSFTIEFTAYNYFNLMINYERGRMGAAISSGKLGIGITNSQKWYEEADFYTFFEELKNELELRIPDKYLKHYGWM
ncbi:MULTISPECIES: hypothetical protein [unclassified Breznakia]|uniref:hypothetical protein n=1 Tax=unclassified Breznakia TaxID=2623764 RepID=UPI0024745AFE|nr:MULTISPECIES: hypothetical protein [unclassified Breznakia]MDH6366894.1 hypothetical protein [Breznakia sp. PH1-1]MDH6404072.1 hypothetical protein [Breznakia sp. PF1-11]MDH6411706.1 hypothetical protein [Breznakia sp. PFB1-11]MDH6414060.1 hypothetical protein [Breznakia sp. PFB1-14]MDH6416490.1 hypothetical protein [Breznakia sp. PFB1-4]